MEIGVGYIEQEKIGVIEITADEYGITSIKFVNELGKENETDLIKECKKQLKEYFLGQRQIFDLPLSMVGTEFQITVWKELVKIPYAVTLTYKDIAEKIGKPKACRAVGGANNKNKIGIVIPCHRVIGKNGTLTGYAGGIDKKEYLLNLEKGML